ncbi:MAG: phosphoribosyl-AMP cyclohydrolase [Pseudomonadota bacterium]
MAGNTDETSVFAPKFGADGLLTAIIVDAENAPLMVAHMNAEALHKTLDTGICWFWSRSRQALWCKGETSGNTLTVINMLTDCDQDVLWITASIAGDGAACHTGRRSCFYRRVEGDQLVFID